MNKSAFVPGRLISDNVLVAFEMFHYIKSSMHSEGSMAVKLDMSKAYNRVQWVFPQAVLDKLGFNAGWSDRVMYYAS